MRKRVLGEQQATHRAYLVRLWREPHDSVWRASLKTTANDQEIAFASLDELFVYLLRQTEALGEAEAQVPIAHGGKIMATDDVQFNPQEDALHFVIGHDAIPTMTRKGEDAPTNEVVEANANLITQALEAVGLTHGYVGIRLGLAFAAALIQRRGDVFNADTGNGIYWPISWNVFGGLVEVASRPQADYPDMIADLTSEMVDSLMAWKEPMPI